MQPPHMVSVLVPGTSASSGLLLNILVLEVLDPNAGLSNLSGLSLKKCQPKAGHHRRHIFDSLS